MSCRSEALQSLKSHYGRLAGPVYTSKFYEAQESWTKTHVWMLQVPARHIEGKQETNTTARLGSPSLVINGRAPGLHDPTDS